MRARFKGEKDNLGYKPDQVYELDLVDPQGLGSIAIEKVLTLYTDNIFRSFCPYRTDQDFLDNWELIPYPWDKK